VEFYETCLIWMVDTATTLLHASCMTIHQAKNFFVPNDCIDSRRSEQSWCGHYCTSWMRFSKAIIFTTIYPPTTSFFIFQRTSQKCTSEYVIATKVTEPMKSLYTFRDNNSKNEKMRGRWWVDPNIIYVHQVDLAAEVIPVLTRASEEYVVAKIASRIFGGHMSKDYHQLGAD
jgi:hypothetical protein